MSDQDRIAELEHKVQKLQGKVDRLVQENNALKAERDNYRASATMLQAGVNISGIHELIKNLQAENDNLQAIVDFMTAHALSLMSDVTKTMTEQYKTQLLEETAALQVGAESQGRDLLLMTQFVAGVQEGTLEGFSKAFSEAAANDETAIALESLPREIGDFYTRLKQFGWDTWEGAWYALQIGTITSMRAIEGDGIAMAQDILIALDGGCSIDPGLVKNILPLLREELSERPPLLRSVLEGLHTAWEYQKSGRKLVHFAADKGLTESGLKRYIKYLEVVQKLATVEAKDVS